MTGKGLQGPVLPWWAGLCGSVAETFLFTAEEREAFGLSRTARLIGSIPFAAGCDEPERTGLVHLALYVTELRGGSKVLGHIPADDAGLFRRLRFIGTFSGGDEGIIRHGMNYLALIMLTGYERSREADLRDGVYNPLNTGAWDAAELKAGLLKAIEGYSCDVLDGIMAFGGALATWKG